MRLSSGLLRRLLLVVAMFASPLGAIQEGDATRPSETGATQPSSRPGEGAQEAESRPASRPGDRDGNARAGGDRPDGDALPKKPRRGIKVTELLVTSNCAVCHKVDEDGFMGRISFMRKSPEGWEMSLKRMIRQHQLPLTPDEAKKIVRYLSNDHGLARAEAERGLYESERRVHWSDLPPDEDLKATCSACHTLGRVHSEQRDAEEWKLLKATHLAFFPLADFQAFRGNQQRGGGDIDFRNLSEAEIEEALERRREQQRAQGDRADKVLDKLAKDQPLFTPEWNAWQINRREVPLEGQWILSGHEIGRGDVAGTVSMRRTAEDEYETEWVIHYGDGQTVTRKGRGLLYAGYSWRGRSNLSGADPKDKKELKEVLLLSDDWNRFEGRIFTGAYSELGADVTLDRRTGQTRVTAVQNGAMMAPSEGHVVDLFGESFPPDVKATDFDLGRGCKITKAERVADDHVRITVDVERKAERGARRVSYRATLGPQTIILYDTIDYIRVFPERGLSRTGGERIPKQFERFECYAMSRGPDDELRTADDYRIMQVTPAWSLEEFPVREDDDDVRYVGALDPRTALFTPAVDGPNPARKFQANNVGEVYVVATTTLTVRKLPPKPKKKPASRPTSRPESQPGEPASETRPAETQPESQPVEAAPKEDEGPIVMETKEFRARGRLLVTVPLYARWDVLEWEDE